jgi:hypothetical protein
MKRWTRMLLGGLAALMFATAGCDQSTRYDQAVAILIDVSGTYADRKGDTIDLIKRHVLPDMVPGDTVFVIRIDSESYDENDLVALMTLDHRPSQANAQKLALAQQLDRFAKKQENASHTDIPGAIMLASEYLREIGAGSSSILVFSDMQTDLPPGAKRTLEAGELEGTHVAAVNVKRLPADTQDPLVYRSRLARWEREVKHAGASGWRAILDPTRLTPYLAEIRG